MATGLPSFQMFWSNLIRYVVLAAQIALAAGIAAIITMVLKYAIGCRAAATFAAQDGRGRNPFGLTFRKPHDA
jgi:hypothetical protein